MTVHGVSSDGRRIAPTYREFQNATLVKSCMSIVVIPTPVPTVFIRAPRADPCCLSVLHSTDV